MTLRRSLIAADPGRCSPRRSAAANITGIAVYPPDVNLNTQLDYQRFIVVATRDDGVTLDVTKEAAVKLGDAQFARLDGRTRVSRWPTATRRWRSSTRATRPPRRSAVKDAAADRPISFQLDVMPVFMRAGCNIGSCHGAARGKDGFRLSLFGFDPKGDYHRLTREEAVRRINLAVPGSEPADREGDRGRAAHRRQAVREGQPVLPDAAALAGSRRAAGRRPNRRTSRSWSSIRRRP